MVLLFLLCLFWFIREIKASLFWLYLWQLKEYHIGRFLDHFQTYNGKTIFWNKIEALKIFIMVVGFLFFQTISRFIFGVVIFLTLLYFLESAKGFLDFLKRNLRRPVLTKKMIVLVSVSLSFELFFLLSLFQKTTSFVFYLLLFDLLTPAVISGIVLLFQPVSVLIKRRIIKRAKEKRKSFKKLLVIGITGSYGKTSTKEFLAEILSQKYNVLKTKEHQNSEIGISQWILHELRPEHEVFVVEMGAYNKGGIRSLTDLVQPQIGILTGINEQHLSTFGSFDNIKKAKYELIESLPADGLAVFNGNNKYCRELYKKTYIKKKIIFPQNTNNLTDTIFPDLRADNINIEREHISFKGIYREGDEAEFKVNLIGRQNIENILLAAITAMELGMSLKEISLISQTKLKNGAMSLIKTKRGLNIVDSTYSANPNGVISDLDYLNTWSGKRAVVMPCLIELGGSSKEIHRMIGREIAKVCHLAVITTRDRFKEIKEGAMENGMKNIFYINDVKEIIKKVSGFNLKDDIILLEGRLPKRLIKQLIYV